MFPLVSIISSTFALGPSALTLSTVTTTLSVGVEPPTFAPRIVIVSVATYPVPGVVTDTAVSYTHLTLPTSFEV